MILFSKEIAKRLGVHQNTLQKREFQRRIKLPVGKIGKRIAISESIFEEWVLNNFGVNTDEATKEN